MRKVKKEEDKRKTVSVSINPDIYRLFEKYCEVNKIENYSNYIEKLIIQKLNLK